VDKVPKDKGRERVRDKLMPFLESFDDIQNQLTDKLDENDIREGSDLVVSNTCTLLLLTYVLTYLLTYLLLES
jgi:hypothetical protein